MFYTTSSRVGELRVNILWILKMRLEKVKAQKFEGNDLDVKIFH